MSTIKQQISKGHQKWNKGVDPIDNTAANKYIKYRLFKYKYYKFIDSDLWEQFKKDFINFLKEILKQPFY